VLSRVLVAATLAALLVAGGAIAFLRTDFVANNLCAYAVATIEETTAADVRVRFEIQVVDQLVVRRVEADRILEQPHRCLARTPPRGRGNRQVVEDQRVIGL